ncbi:hypothetical protein [Clostridium drakei]|uniref:Restriction endonuclease type IV Mrr domain-containing protein n=1 Tax=Clostridium drakei TaxID=332101 RepID=A0A2U8DX93_9CLOT|nr:hypothetical protein [Clostridium drakei]AWI07015.1 hypothetical protein B9W14_21925 [Clostridium drakei]
MNNLFFKSCFTGQKTEFYEMKLKKVSINEISDSITKSCWNYNIQYEMILKDSNTLLIDLMGKEKEILLKYHKKDIITKNDYEGFINYLESYEIKRGIYITTGFFEKYMYNNLHKKIKKIDIKKFIKKQPNIDKLNFLQYLP